MTIYDEIEVRRAEQIAKGYDAGHDDAHTKGEIAQAAAAYATAGAKKSQVGAAIWPWSIDQFRPKGARNSLIDAAALCVAEIERIDRLNGARPTCACKGADRWQCWAIRNNKPLHIVDFRHEVKIGGGPCECGCHANAE